uniref:hypothetical protein n=1 Tax=Escherichia coli TaxID=562 RepID=UPI001F30D68E|nr:hypothetical protein [Escherichia coli]
MLGTPFKAVTKVGFFLSGTGRLFFYTLVPAGDTFARSRKKVTFIDRPERLEANKHYLALKYAPVCHQIGVCRFTTVQTNQKAGKQRYKE